MSSESVQAFCDGIPEFPQAFCDTLKAFGTAIDDTALAAGKDAARGFKLAMETSVLELVKVEPVPHVSTYRY